MFRALLVLSLIAGVVHPADATPRTAKSSIKAKKSKKKGKREKQISRTPTKRSLSRTDNMPKGFVWPPNRAMHLAEKACEAKLDEIGLAYKKTKGEGRIVDAITLSEENSFTVGNIRYVSAFRNGAQKLDCQLAVALSSFAPKLEELGVQQVTFGSIFRWTNVRVMGKTKNILSRHALGIAMDIVSFLDETGREANVKKDYPTGDALLLAVETAVHDSGRFRTLLTPKNDPISHSDHFHVEVAVDYTAAK
jgi:hypothetical protein